MSNKKQTCCKQIACLGGFHSHDCTKRVTVTRAGRNYCAIHDPEYISKKRAEKEKQWEKENKIEQKKWALRDAGPSLLALAKRIAALNPKCSEIGPGMLASLIEDANRAIAIAEKNEQ